MNYGLAFFGFVLGAIIGSFLNVVILRYNTGLGINDRSFCPICGKKLKWFELVPIFSFLALRGRCRSCQTKISWQYPLVEALTGGLFLAIFLMRLPVTTTIIYLAIWSVLVVIGVYDLRHKIIPDLPVYLFSLLAFASLVSRSPAGELVSSVFLDRLLSGALLALPFLFIFLISRGAWMGLGDAKLAFGIGILLGLSFGVTATLFAFWFGAIVSLLFLAIKPLLGSLNLPHKNLTMKSEIPFAPFLIVGTGVVFFTGVNLANLISFFN